MTHDRLIQIIAAAVLLVGAFACGSVLPSLNRISQEHLLRYTNEPVEGAPPIVAVGTAIGALRGIIVDYLWIKVNLMKEKGLFYEVMADSDLITKLQPRFAQVWAFHGHNMAYNISVATDTEQERWEWVQAGIDLVRNKGLRYNPNDLVLHKDLAFWFSHKIEGVNDDAHFYYKRKFTEEWHFVLGDPPYEHEARIAWIKAVADAADTLDEAENRTPGVKALTEQLRSVMEASREGFEFKLDKRFLRDFSIWQAAKGQSAAARILGIEEQLRRQYPSYDSFDTLARDPALQPQWTELIAHVRKRVLLDQYNMDPQFMYELTRDLGPIDWRHGSSHALYWTRLGSKNGEQRQANVEDVYNVLNNDGQSLHAMQDLARFGYVTFDPFANDHAGRLPDPRWIDSMIPEFRRLYAKHTTTRGAGGERFISFIENFIGSSICYWFRAGETQRADHLMKQMDELFGMGAQTPNYAYSVPVASFCREQTAGEYEYQPHVAVRDVMASLEHGIREGIGNDRPDVLREAINFARSITDFYKSNEAIDFTTKFGTGRMAELLSTLEGSIVFAYRDFISNPRFQLEDRMTVWSKTPNVVDIVGIDLRLPVYDDVKGELSRQMAISVFHKLGVDQFFPAPPGIEQYRIQKAENERLQREREQADQQNRAEFDRR
jgi:hypothetical protein